MPGVLSLKCVSSALSMPHSKATTHARPEIHCPFFSPRPSAFFGKVRTNLRGLFLLRLSDHVKPNFQFSIKSSAFCNNLITSNNLLHLVNFPKKTKKMPENHLPKPTWGRQPHPEPRFSMLLSTSFWRKWAWNHVTKPRINMNKPSSILLWTSWTIVDNRKLIIGSWLYQLLLGLHGFITFTVAWFATSVRVDCSKIWCINQDQEVGNQPWPILTGWQSTFRSQQWSRCASLCLVTKSGLSAKICTKNLTGIESGNKKMAIWGLP